jgi:hypothetical protein
VKPAFTVPTAAPSRHHPPPGLLASSGGASADDATLDGVPAGAGEGAVTARNDIERTDQGMPNAHYVPHLLRRATQVEPTAERPRAAKTISRVEVSVVAPAVADPAVLVRLHDDLRLSLDALAKDLGRSLEPLVVTTLATGIITLAPGASIDGDSPLDPLVPDARNRLRLTDGLRHRLAVPIGGQVLVTAAPDGSEVRLINLATLADLLAAAPLETAAPVAEGPAPGRRQLELVR